MCGGELNISDDMKIIECDYCGTKQTLPKLDDEQKANLYDRANHFRRNNEYDKAMTIYENILNTDTTDSEAYWSILLCKYGVEYVKDSATGRYIPTINRAQYTSVLADEDYKSAIKYADSIQREIYENEAKYIDEVQKGIIEISQKEEPFDVFICYKETDNNGRRTQDSVLANELYHGLTNEGFRVFFSRITLEDKLGTAYEPYIFAALNSAKVMVVIGTKPEYFNAVWVKNEWSRFLSLIKNGANKILIPAYRDMDPYDLPEEFSHLQAQDMSKLGFMQDLIRGIKKIVSQSENSSTVADNSVTASQNDTSVMIKRAVLSLEDKDWSSAEKYAEKVLDITPECAEAYLVKLLVEIKLSSKEALKNSTVIFSHNPNYTKAVRFADRDLKAFLTSSAEYVNNTQQEKIYNQAKDLLSSENPNDIEKAKAMFESISDYESAEIYISRCDEKIRELKTVAEEAIKTKKRLKIAAIIAPFIIIGIILYAIFVPPLLEYNDAVDDYNNGYYESAYYYFSNSTYKDSAEMALKCQYGYVKENYNNDDQTTYEYLKELKAQNYKDSAELFKDLYKWKVKLKYLNTKSEDYSTTVDTIPQKMSFLHYGFELTGGEPGESATFYFKSSWPGEQIYKSSWYWENYVSGAELGCEYSEGVTSSSGTVTFEIYNKENDEFIGSTSIRVK